MEESVDLIYSDNGINNRTEYLFRSVVTPIIMFVEDKGKEYVYECILKEMYYPKILEKIYVIAAGNKDLVKNRYDELGEYDEEHIYIYLMDGDFDRYLDSVTMICSDSVVYLKRYCLESYFIDENLCVQYLQNHCKLRDYEARNKLKFNEWKFRIVGEAKDLFLYFACLNNYANKNKGFNAKKNVSAAKKVIDMRSGFINRNELSKYYEEQKNEIESYESEKESIHNAYLSINGSDYSNLVCGKFLLNSLVAYIRSVFEDTRIGYDQLFNELIKIYRGANLTELKVCIDKQLQTLN